MKLIVLQALLALSHIQTSATLLDWLPADAQTVVVVNDFEHSWAAYQSGERQVSGESFRERFALEPGDVADLIVGEFLRAELIGVDGASSEVAIARVGADIDDALRKIHARLQQQRVQVTVSSFGSHQGSVITQRGKDGVEHVSVHLIHDGRILLADSVAAANAIVTHLESSEGNSLATQRGFAEVWKQCSTQLKGEALAVAWYTDPWLRVSRQQEAEKPDAAAEEYLFAKRHGISGIVGLGSSVVFGQGGAQTVQAFAYAPKPLTSSLQMATHLTGTENLTIPEWVSKAASEVVVLHGNIGNALEHSGLLFDDGFADGVEGTYDEVLLDLKDLLELDVEKELYPLLGPRAYLINGVVENRDWRPLVVAFEATKTERVAEMLGLLIADDPEAIEVVVAEESDLVWHVPGRRGGRDFVLGMLHGVAVYANDLEFLKAAMRFDGSEPLLRPKTLDVLRDDTVKGIEGRPSLLIVRNPSVEAQTFAVSPLDLVFRGAQFFEDRDIDDVESMQWLPRQLTMLLARHQLVVGFDKKDGWKFVARSADPTGEYRSAP